MTPCFECGAPAVHLHHVVPRSLGGTRTVPLCERCHGKVHGRDFTTVGRLTRAALAAKKSRGELVGSVPFGYSLGADKRTLVPNEGEQHVILVARELRARGLSFRAIGAELERRGLRSRNGSSWKAPQVQRMVVA